MRYLSTILVFLGFLNAAFAQEGQKTERCFGNYCIISQNGLYGVFDKAGKEVIPFSNRYLNFSGQDVSCPGKFFSCQVTGKWGILDINNRTIIPPVLESTGQLSFHCDKCRYIQVRIENKTNSKVMLLSSEGDTILPPDFRRFHIEYYRPDLIFASNDTFQLGKPINEQMTSWEYEVFDSLGKKLSDIKFVNPKNTDLGNGNTAIIGKLKNGNSVIIGHPNIEGLISPEYTTIEKVKGYRIFTYPPDKNGVVYKQLLLPGASSSAPENFGTKHLTKPIYLDFCFDVDCLRKYVDAETEKKFKSVLSAAVGILPDNRFHSFNGSEKLTEIIIKK